MKCNILSVSLALLCLWCALVSVSGQSLSDWVFHGDFDRTTEYVWSSDSTRLTFFNFELSLDEDPNVVIEAPGWQVIDVPTASISPGTNVWPLQTNLTQEELDVFMPYGFIYSSPDANLLIFAQEPDNELGDRDLVLANRSTRQFVSLGVRVGSDLIPSSATVQWASDSHAVIIGFYDWSGAQEVIHIDIPNFNDLEDGFARKFNATIDGKPYIMAPTSEDLLLDLSTDGQAVLLIARDSTRTETTSFYDNSPQLVVWRPYTGEAAVVGSDIPLQGITTGSFAPNNSNRIVVATLGGLFAHDIGIKTTIQLFTEYVDNGLEYFSPDGQWMALSRYDFVAVLSVQDLLMQFPMPTAISTSSP